MEYFLLALFLPEVFFSSWLHLRFEGPSLAIESFGFTSPAFSPKDSGETFTLESSSVLV